MHAEFSLPLTVGPGGIGTFDLCRDRPGMLSDEHLADALVVADTAWPRTRLRFSALRQLG